MRTDASRHRASAGFAALLALAALAAAGRGRAAEKPLWEFGMGIGGVLFQDYRGADSSHFYPLPVPYFVYRGRFLKADRNGIRGLLLRQDHITLNLSVNATTPVRNNAARSGMPDLRPTLEVGPSLDAHLWRSADRRITLDLRVPVRAVFTVESSPREIGTMLTPNIALDAGNLKALPGWNLGLLASPLFVDRHYAGYFYSVAPRYATVTRPAYSASGGYAGSQLLASLAKRYPSFWVGAFVRYDTLAGARFEASPLVKRRSYWAAGFGLAWMIRESHRLVATDE